ncbi:hypothetical protein D2E26_0652 [Bifidobacterium dolichotidis]|uniref:Uncharacterized protein n=2 Tax=Bifidobacterium dolichotidis TaxID=2306976 RepID=A0A430FT94_9BIFI|nr:hypothetical protein D2E26_0652 [Bifidobacterium dolichotidis]
MNTDCLTKLTTYSSLIRDYIVALPDYGGLYASPYPPSPQFIDGMFTDEQHFAATVLLMFGDFQCWCTLSFTSTEQQWRCSTADIG